MSAEAMTAAALGQPAVEALLRPLQPYLNPRPAGSVIEVVINGPGELWVNRTGRGYVREPAAALTRDWAQLLCQTLANTRSLRFSRDMPALGCRLPGGHRLQALLGPNVASGLAIAIRVRRHVTVELGAFGLSDREAAWLRSLVQSGQPLVVCGPMGSGKTTLLNTLARDIPPHKRIITVEDVNELLLPSHPNRVHIEVARFETGSRIGYPQVIDSITRFAPDIVICGELSVESAASSLRLLNLGHGGYLTTGHANSPLDMLEAWRRNYELATHHPAPAVVRFLARTLAAIIHLGVTGAPGREQRQVTIARRGPGGYLDVPWWELTGEPPPGSPSKRPR